MGQAMTGGQQKLGESPGLVAESHVLQEGSANTEAQVTRLWGPCHALSPHAACWPHLCDGHQGGLFPAVCTTFVFGINLLSSIAPTQAQSWPQNCQDLTMAVKVFQPEGAVLFPPDTVGAVLARGCVGRKSSASSRAGQQSRSCWTWLLVPELPLVMLDGPQQIILPLRGSV